MPRKQIVALAAAIALSVATAATAVAVNLRATSDVSPSPAGRLTAVEPATSAPVPSTVVVDVTVPDLPPVTGVPAPAGGGTDTRAPQATTAPEPGGSRPSGSAVQSSGEKAEERSDEGASEDRHETPETEREGASDDD